MTIANDNRLGATIAGLDPSAYGLPSAAEIAQIAGAYFPEFGNGAPADVPVAVPADPLGLPAVTAPSYYVPTSYEPAEMEPSVAAAPVLPAAYDSAPAPAYSAEPNPGVSAPTYSASSAYVPADDLAQPSYAPTLASVDDQNAITVGAIPAASGESANDDISSHHAAAYEQHKYIGNYSLEQIRADFPILSKPVDGKKLVWLDNAATTQRPQQVIDRISYYYENENSNVHRGAHALAARSTDAYEEARDKIAKYLGAPSADNIVYVRGTTEGINLVAHSYVKPLLSPGDEIIVTILEHHANIVPWQIIAAETGAVLRVVPVDASGQIIFSEYTKLFNSKTKFVTMAHVSNALGTITPVSEMVSIAHGFGVPTLVDGAQSISHMPVNVTALDTDFFVFSGHKIFGPTGIGVVYGKSDALKKAKPYQGGGNMIADVTFEKTIYNEAPQKFEAGTGNIADAVGLGAAIDYVSKIGIANIAA
ncbi:MAG: aminotransferase class V-fold PLP-dependent enzyme, partial [Clostridiales Family XIII bacterium]|nr:aminotransferase class V-fold PLP-dependent enzyme [Clostridiales Family XIII bacterium]